MRWLVVLVLAGCIEPNLVPCGDLVCPAGAQCLLDRHACAFPDAIAACDGKSDGTLCQAQGIDGACDRGLCVASVCGDGAATGREQCDGTDLASHTCADFRFYYGELACSSACLLDTSGCSGTCGDGLVQSDHGEICDNTKPPRGCYALGHDYGHVTCTPLCLDSSATDCGEYMPVVLMQAEGPDPNDDTVNDVWKDLDLLVVSRKSGLVVIDHGIRTDIAGDFQRIAAHAGTVVVGKGGEIDRIDHGALVAEPDLGANGAKVVAQAFAPTGELWALTLDCQVRELVAGAWQQKAAIVDTGCSDIGVDANGDVYATTAASARWFDGTAWTKSGPIGLGSVQKLGAGMSGNLLVVTTQGSYELHQAATAKTPVTEYAFDVVAVGDAYVFTSLLAGRYWGNQLHFFASMPDEPVGLRRGSDGTVVMFNSSVYVLQPVMMGEGDLLPYVGVKAGTAREFITWANTLLYAPRAGSKDLGSTVRDVALVGETIYALTDAGVMTGSWAGAFTTDAGATGNTIWADAAGDLAVVRSDGIVVKPAGSGTWTPLPDHGCAIALGVAGPSLAELYAARNCADGSAEIDLYTGAAWTTVKTLLPGATSVGFSNIAMLADGTIVLGGIEVAIGRNSAWTIVPSTAYGAAGTSANDIWFAEVPNGAGPYEMGHWNGSELELVRRPAQMNVASIAVDDHSVFVNGNDSMGVATSHILARFALP